MPISKENALKAVERNKLVVEALGRSPGGMTWTMLSTLVKNRLTSGSLGRALDPSNPMSLMRLGIVQKDYSGPRDAIVYRLTGRPIPQMSRKTSGRYLNMKETRRRIEETTRDYGDEWGLRRSKNTKLLMPSERIRQKRALRKNQLKNAVILS